MPAEAHDNTAKLVAALSKKVNLWARKGMKESKKIIIWEDLGLVFHGFSKLIRIGMSRMLNGINLN
jgi:hypothetical protein